MKNPQYSEKHQFALYVPDLSGLVNAKKTFALTDPDLVHRIVSVLRLEQGQLVLLFDQAIQCAASITDIVKKKSVQLSVLQTMHNVVMQPTLTFGLPLLKRDALETALYSLTEIGVNHIQLIYTSKSQKQWSAKDQERAQKIIIAAAEQSKNFAFPTLLPPIELSQFVTALKDRKIITIVLDILGHSLFSFLEHEKNKALAELSCHIALIIGPEGGLTQEEKETILSVPNSQMARLTPTVLRASQAAAVCAALVRSALCTNHKDLSLDLDRCS